MITNTLTNDNKNAFRVTRIHNGKRHELACVGVLSRAIELEIQWSAMSNSERSIWLKQRNKEAAKNA